MKISLRILVAAASLAIAAPVYAQGGGGGGGGMQMTPEQRLARTKEQMFKEITLTADQTTKIDTILVQATRKSAEARAAGMDMRSPEGQAKMKEMNDARNAALKAVLATDADKAKFDANVAAMGTGRGRGGF
jgi:Spy/CpxP family protein refolding chaperone